MFQKKSLGQNFLTSKKIIADIVKAGEVTAGDTVLEAGPGTGILTEALLSAGANVIAVEKDDRLIPVLQKKFAQEISTDQLKLIHSDILEFTPSPSALNATRYKIIANIPYYITGQFIRKFLEAEFQPTTLVIMIQKEVAERIVARDGKGSLLSIAVKAYGAPRLVSVVKKGNFSPPPNVDSAILAVTEISKKFFTDFSEQHFFEILKAGFGHKRKILSSNLKPLLGNGTEVKILNCGLSPKTRAEELSLENWLCLSVERNTPI